MQTILIVDDISSNIDLLREILSSSYRLKMAKNGSSALKIISADEKPDLVLLDVMMPEMDGYEVCQRIKDDPVTKDIPVIFVSALSTAEEQIKGFESGAEDYIPKPVDANNLLAKIHNALENKKKKAADKETLNYAQTTAMTALTTMSEMGAVSTFFKELPSVTNFEGLVKKLLTFIKAFNLTAVLRLDVNIQDPIYGSTNGNVLPIEKTLLSKLRTQGAVYNFKAGTVFNYKYISVLIVDMPIGDDELYGRLKDHLATAVDGSTPAIENLIAATMKDNVAAEDKGTVDRYHQIVPTIKRVLDIIENQQVRYQAENKRIMNTLVESVENSFLHLGLEESQEEFLIDLVTNTNNQIEELFESNKELEERIGLMRAFLAM
ncbi:MAG: response regulator [Gammaproteobacteria bacterium]|nr:response regulator [Gammaproteobacteria bacterium]